MLYINYMTVVLHQLAHPAIFWIVVKKYGERQ